MKSLILRLLENSLGGSSKGNISLKNIYDSDACLLLGTGVSIDEIELRKIKNIKIFGCNLIYYLKDFYSINLDFYAAINHFLAYDPVSQKKMYKDLFQANQNSNTKFFIRSLNKLIIPRSSLPKDSIYYVKGGKSKDGLNNIYDKNINYCDISKSVFLFSNVFEFMIAACLYLGFKKIYLAGFGYTYYPKLHYHFYDEFEDFDLNLPWEKPIFNINDKATQEKFALDRGFKIFKRIKLNDSEVCRFIDYKQDDLSRHKLINSIASANNAKIYNIVPDGLESPIYPKISKHALYE